MKLERLESAVRWAGGVSIMVFVVAVYVGLFRGLGQGRGRSTGPAPGAMRGLRFYAPASVFGMALAWRMWRPLPVSLSERARALALALGAPMYFGGLALLFWGRFTLGRNYGVSSSLGAELYEGHELVTSGPFAYIRHPMYLGGLLWSAGGALIYRNWLMLVTALGMPFSLGMRARREEEALSAEFGEAYEAYRQRVPALLPRLQARP